MQTSIIYEQGSINDTYEAYLLFEETLSDLIKRLGFAGATSWGDAEKLENMWQQRRRLVEHMTRTKEHFWLAKQEGQIVGYARTLLRDGVRELTDFFVKPSVQSGGVGCSLIDRPALPQLQT